jgi:O-antigen/teichoic acid export membrane protein
LSLFLRLIMPVFGLMGARLAGAGFGFLSQLLLARALAPDQAGIAFLAISVTTFVSLLITGGYHAIGLTYLARYQTFGRTWLLAGFFRAARKDMLILALAALVLASLLWLLPADRGMIMAGFWGTLAAIPLAAIRLNNSAANAQKRFALSYAPDFVFRPLLLLLVIGALVLFGATQSAIPVLVALPLIALGVALAQAWLMGPDDALRPHTAPATDLRPFYRKRALAMLAVTIAGGATADLVVMIGGFFLPPAEVAVLGVAVRIAALAGFFALASQQFVLRDLVSARANRDASVLDSVLFRTNITSLGSIMFVLLAMVVVGPWLLAAFGTHYADAYWPLLVFLVSQAVRVMGGMNAQLLALGGHQVRSAALCLGVVAGLVVLAAILAPIWGVLGLAVATLVAELAWAVGLAIITQRLEGKRADIFAGGLGRLSFGGQG